MKIKYLSIVLALVVCSGCKQSGIKDLPSHTGQESTPPDEIYKFCETAPCRKNLRVRLQKSKGEYFDETYEYMPPVIQSMFISIYPGESIYIEADEGKDGPVNLVHVPEIKNLEKTIQLSLKQSDMGDGLGMALVVRNPFPRTLRYNLGMMPLGSDELYKTSSCPAFAKASAYESWPFPIFQIVVGNMRFLKEGESLVCEE